MPYDYVGERYTGLIVSRSRSSRRRRPSSNIRLSSRLHCRLEADCCLDTVKGNIEKSLGEALHSPLLYCMKVALIIESQRLSFLNIVIIHTPRLEHHHLKVLNTHSLLLPVASSFRPSFRPKNFLRTHPDLGARSSTCRTPPIPKRIPPRRLPQCLLQSATL